MFRITRARAILVTAFAAVTAGCAHQAPPIVAIAAPPPAIPARPVLSPYLGAIVPPAIGPDGTYLTINHGIAAEQAMWHVRAALNVAAIGCRGVDGGAAITSAYNALLTNQKAALALANTVVEGNFRRQYGASAWQGAHDAYMTRLYNFFAQPAAKAAFCAVAAPLAAQAAVTPQAQFTAFAATALPALEAPFLAVYREVDAYRTDVAMWDARYGNAADRTSLAAAGSMLPAPAHEAGAPRLAYCDMDRLIAWEPVRGVALASR